ncbi:tyrosine-protein phosphatase [Saccharopolyspora pogona]|nr:tyrosine-protein phosphatase [Saccharopolyspora pogona]
MSRDLQWDGGYNVRDLGGLPAADGRRVRAGVLSCGPRARRS